VSATLCEGLLDFGHLSFCICDVSVKAIYLLHNLISIVKATCPYIIIIRPAPHRFFIFVTYAIPFGDLCMKYLDAALTPLVFESKRIHFGFAYRASAFWASRSLIGNNVVAFWFWAFDHSH
jgi:hypothetical protein